MIERIINVALSFSYTEPIRRAMYTTNIVEGYHRQLRKATKSKSVYPSDEALLRHLYLVFGRISAKWGKSRDDKC